MTDMHPETRPQRGPHEPHVVCRHADVVAAATDPATYSSAVSRHLQIPNGLDGEEHARFRPLVESFFTPDRMAELTPGLESLAREAVASLPRDREVDAMADLGTPYAIRATCTWLGWSLEMEDELREWMRDNHAATRSGEYARTAEVAARFDAIIRRLVDERSAPDTGGTTAPAGDATPRPPHDVTTELIGSRVEGRPLTEEEIVSVLRNWTAGDIASVALCVGVVLRYAAEHPAVQDRLRAVLEDDEALDLALDEILRIDDPFVANRRVATRDARLGDLEVAEGERLLLSWTEANRDPARFDDPDRYDPEGNADGNLVWGIGPHVCPGRPLAMLELRVLVRTLLGATGRVKAVGTPVREEPPLGGYRTAPVLLRG